MRDITVYTSLSEAPSVLTLNGFIPMSKELVKRTFRTKIGENLYAKSDVLFMGNLYKDKQCKIQMELINTSEKTIDLGIDVFPNYKWVEVVGSKKLPPWEPEKLTITCNGFDTESIWGEKEFYVMVNSYMIRCFVSIIPFSFKRIQKHGAKVFISSSNTSNSSNASLIEIRNVGNKDLKIFKVQSSRSSISTIIDPIIPVMNSGYIRVEKSSKSDKDTLEILTNDAMNPVIRIGIE